MDLTESRLVTRRALCEAAGISYSTAQRFEKAGIIVAAYSIGGRLRRYDLADCLARIRAAGAVPPKPAK